MRALLAVLVVLAPAFASAQDIVAARNMRAGTVLGPGDVVAAPGREVAVGALETITGLALRQSVYAGRAVTRDILGPPVLVRRNTTVRMIFRRGGLGMRTEGRALAAGGEGERIPVLNLASRNRVDGVIIGPGLVEVRR